MKISRLRLLGFKSFVEPTELVIEPGLTGVVGPNGCGKSNLLEALRWVMGETSHKSMRAAAMDDVIFSGTTQRPARNAAEVTIVLDNSERLAPAEWNELELIEITRRIEREAGSAYRINGREARARDVKILFEDAATGARSPALVRQGQISEIVNAKPEQRRRVLEDAAGVAGLHSRRHEAELRLKATEANLARLTDIMGQLSTQVEGLKRQARHARRYKDLSEEIRRAEALLAHLTWLDAQAAVEREEQDLAEALLTLATATEAESKALRDEAHLAEGMTPLREAEAARGAAVSRIRIEAESLERDAVRSEERRRELMAQKADFAADLDREMGLISEAREILASLETEEQAILKAEAEADAMEDHLHGAREDAEAALADAEKTLTRITERAAERRARLKSLESAEAERCAHIERIEANLANLAKEATAAALNAPDSIKLATVMEQGNALARELQTVEQSTLDAEEAEAELASTAKAKRDAAAKARLALASLMTERETLSKFLMPTNDGGQPPVVDAIKVSPGYEAALVAALGDDLDAPIADEAPVRWRSIAIAPDDGALPADAEPLSRHVDAPQELARRLRQIGVVERASGPTLQPHLKPGQRLVSREGDLWRWDGYSVVRGGLTPAALRLAERNRLAGMLEKEAEAKDLAARLAEEEQTAARALAAKETETRSLRAVWRDTQAKLVTTRDTLNALERAARETEARLMAVAENRARAEADLTEAKAFLDQTQDALALLEDEENPEKLLEPAQRDTARHRMALQTATTHLSVHEREQAMRRARRDAIAAERARWMTRSQGATAQIEALKERVERATADSQALAELLPALEARRQDLLSALSDAQAARTDAADRVAAADQALRAAAAVLREAQGRVLAGREARARTEARLEAARIRRQDDARRIRETLNMAPEDCLRLSGISPNADGMLPPLADAERAVQRLKADRDRLGGVNLQADDELTVLLEQVSSMETERHDVEQAIAKLRGAIGQLNREGKKRLDEAFQTVNSHFQRLFSTLFGGGEARLEMIEGEDPLESGLEIIAKPPGKKPATLSLLSGGEQTLTALSLIFAVFLTNPSPICVLDEVDAPLDDANVDRFCTLMEKMAEETATRFLVITHHPMTMTRMNRLFGVTMAEKGVSQLVSVDLETARTFREAV